MSIRIGSTRVGHRVGGFYMSTPVTGRNAGRQVRVGHRLPGGFYASVPITVDGRRRPRPPIGSYSCGVMIATTVVFVGLAVLFLVAGGWPLTLLLIGVIAYQWLVWAANPQQRQPHQQSR